MLWHEICSFISVKRYLIIGFFLLLFSSLGAQETDVPQRTPEEEAMKQTELLQRELELSQEQHDTIYTIYLKYARLRRGSNTRQEALSRLNKMTEEILGVLTPHQRELFLNKQMSWHSKHAVPRTPRPNDTLRTARMPQRSE